MTIDIETGILEVEGQRFFSRKPPKTKTKYFFDGRYFITEEELWIAQMLSVANIPYLYEVDFSVMGYNGKRRNFSPDFVFAWHKWTGSICHKSSIMGIEVKKKRRRRGPSLDLNYNLRIPVLVVNRSDIEPYFRRFETYGDLLPLRPLLQPA